MLSLPIRSRLLLVRYPNELSEVLEIIHRALCTHIADRAVFSNKKAEAGEVTITQLFGSALSLNFHFHMLFVKK